LHLDPHDTRLWYVAGWIITPFLAGLAALRAAAKSAGSGRRAWHCFALSSFLWMIGTMVWTGHGWFGAESSFPSLADLFYVFTAVAFMQGMFHYSLPGSGGGRIQLTNFALAILAVVAIGFILYFRDLISSEIGWLGVVLAFAYPALWLSTFVFGLLCYSLYVPGHRKFPFLLILGAASANAVANYFYGLDILGQRYAAGTHYDVFWILAFAFLAWAALEHRYHGGLGLTDSGRKRLAVRSREALIPALSVAAILLTGFAARWHELPTAALSIVPVILGFAALLAVREHTLFATERRLRSQAEETARRLAESEARLSGVLETTTDGVLMLDAEWRITFANRKAIEQLFPNRPYLGIQMWKVLGSSPISEFYHNYRVAFEQQKPLSFEAYFPPMDRWFEDHVFPTPNSLTIFFRDVTERRRLREELVRQAQQDPLTGLANRALFAERLVIGLQSGRRPSDLILVMIDLDDFKSINDSLGHLAGDTLVKQFSRRLTGLVRQGDTVARFGGDEFAIVQPGPVRPDAGAEIARRINEALQTPFTIHGHEVNLAVSIGIAIAPQHGTRSDDLINNADLALYRAKANKGSGLNHCIFDPELDEPLDARRSPAGMREASA
jgi:diguanylate cyclase (GGDEF)-like protein